jgi:hypothetical protein
MAQMIGLSEQQISLKGTVTAPTLVNGSSHRILAYTLLFQNSSGQTIQARIQSFLGEYSRQGAGNAGIAPGGERPWKTYAETNPNPLESATQVVLDSALYDTGQLVGPDQANSFDTLRGDIDGERAAHALLLADPQSPTVWVSIEAAMNGQMSPPSGSKYYQNAYNLMARMMAKELVRVNQKAGLQRALRIAQSSQSYPAIYR